jgi:hypothetical protein
MKNSKVLSGLVFLLSLFSVVTIYVLTTDQVFNITPEEELVVEAIEFEGIEVEDIAPLIIPQDISYDYDVIVISGEPEGVAAAVAAARQGSKVLLLEKRDGLGGLFTYGMLNQLDLGYDYERKLANQGIFLEWFKMIGSKGNFDIPLAKAAFMELVNKEPNITLQLNTMVVDTVLQNNTLVGLVINDGLVDQTVYAKRFIDSTASADIAAMSGAPYFIGQQDMGMDEVKMAVTLVMLIDDVDWDRFSTYGMSALGGGRVHKNISWGFADVPSLYEPIEQGTRVRGLNIGIQSNGVVTINALQIFGVDTLDPTSIQEGIERGKRETDNFVFFLRENLPGFENASVSAYPPELYIRESRHILSEYQLPISDVWENKDHWDSIGLGAYPVDVQATHVNGYGMLIVAPVQYAIPFRTIIPLEIDNLLVASKASGYSSLAAGSARTVPIGMTAGQAAGVAASLSIEEDITFRELSQDRALVEILQNRLIAQGSLIYPFELPYPYQDEWFYPAIKKLMQQGLIVGGYKNDIRPDDLMSEREFLKSLTEVVFRTKPELYTQLSSESFVPYDLGMTKPWSIILTRDAAASYILEFFGEESEEDPWKIAIKNGYIDAEMEERVTVDRELSKAEGYYILAHILDLVQED